MGVALGLRRGTGVAGRPRRARLLPRVLPVSRRSLCCLTRRCSLSRRVNRVWS
jgi:hypothetical protein